MGKRTLTLVLDGELALEGVPLSQEARAMQSNVIADVAMETRIRENVRGCIGGSPERSYRNARRMAAISDTLILALFADRNKWI